MHQYNFLRLVTILLILTFSLYITVFCDVCDVKRLTSTTADTCETYAAALSIAILRVHARTHTHILNYYFTFIH